MQPRLRFSRWCWRCIGEPCRQRPHHSRHQLLLTLTSMHMIADMIADMVADMIADMIADGHNGMSCLNGCAVLGSHSL